MDSEQAAKLIEAVNQDLPMTVAQEDGIQATAIECMTNTKEHASGSKNHQRKTKWWFSAYCNPETKKAQFAFFDLGVGIFASLEKRDEPWLKRMFVSMGSMNRTDLLRELLADRKRSDQGMVKRRSRTDKQYRGRGLPTIAKRNRLRHTRRLIIVSNDVYADVESDDYR